MSLVVKIPGLKVDEGVTTGVKETKGGVEGSWVDDGMNELTLLTCVL